MLGRPDWEEKTDAVIRAFSGAVGPGPAGHCHLLMAIDFAVGPSYEVVIAGEEGANDTQALLAAARVGFRPDVVWLLRTETNAEALATLAPWTREQLPRDGRATAYVCRAGACEEPTPEPARVIELLGS